MDELDFNLYVIAELRYKKLHQGESNIFPIDWYSSKDYKLKNKIIAEAIDKNIAIKNTKLYQNKFIENNDL